MRPRSWLDPYESLAAQEYCSRLERNGVRCVRSARRRCSRTRISSSARCSTHTRSSAAAGECEQQE